MSARSSMSVSLASPCDSSASRGTRSTSYSYLGGASSRCPPVPPAGTAMNEDSRTCTFPTGMASSRLSLPSHTVTTRCVSRSDRRTGRTNALPFPFDGQEGDALLYTMPVTAVRDRQTPSEVWSMQNRSPSVPSPTYSPLPDTTTAHSSQSSSPPALEASSATSPPSVAPMWRPASCAAASAAATLLSPPPGNPVMPSDATSAISQVCARNPASTAALLPPLLHNY
mmetsp:Transcript_44340/g.105628  ORF Transcript_44340/g.105628 Transcript_44340/m.105628 type:complete len:226 (+) Transcript_44340:1578-2255(+)